MIVIDLITIIKVIINNEGNENDNGSNENKGNDLDEDEGVK